MLFAYRLADARLERLRPDAPLGDAIWVDLYRPQPEQSARVLAELGVEVPTLADMEEIEISNRFYREAGPVGAPGRAPEGGQDVMTVLLPGALPDGAQATGPVSFILSDRRLVTVRHHAPRPFETFPARADRSSTGCATPARLFLGLVEEVVGRGADILEASGRTLDAIAARVYAGAREALTPDELEEALRSIGREGETLARVRLGLLSVERMLSFFLLWSEQRPGASSEAKALRAPIKSLQRDINALEVHADFLSGRVGLATDTTLGMVNLSQNSSVRMMSVVAALFLPPTLIASVYGMNFAHMPELGWRLGYPLSLLAMVGSAAATWAWFKWRGWI